MTPQRVILLGGLGFLGSHITRALVHDGHDVTVFDRPGAHADLIRDVYDRVRLIDGDALSAPQVLSAIRDQQTVIHLVHTTVPASSMRDPVFDVTSNIAGTVGWLKDLDQTGVERLVYVSSGGTVYGPAQTHPIAEDHPTHPISAYGISKLTLEKYVAMYATLYERRYTILRPANVYGVGQKLHISQGVIGVMMDRALRGQPFGLWGDGRAVRDYLYASDLGAAVAAVLNTSGAAQVFNVGTGQGYSVLQLIDAVQAVLGRPLEIVRHEAGGYNVPISVLDVRRIQDATGWRATVGLQQGLRLTFDWLRSRGM